MISDPSTHRRRLNGAAAAAGAACLLAGASLAHASTFSFAEQGTTQVIELVGPSGSYRVVAGEILVRFNEERPVSDVDRIARGLGSQVLGGSERSGLWRLKIPRAMSVYGFLSRARTTPGVAWAGPNALTEGSGSCYPDTSEHLDKEWNLPRFTHPEACQDYNLGLEGVVVAVLDTGIAYEDQIIGGVQYLHAPDLADATIVAPYNAFDGSDNALDDHQHGTHIAGIIAARGGIVGAAPGVQLMPVKVLDHDKVGSEFSLIEGLLYAVDQGADVVNMSLSFGPGYFPSPELQAAVAAASEAGVVMVAASGNDGIAGVSWPAAFPDVIGVGASQPKTSNGQGGGTQDEDEAAAYSNFGFALDLMAPGGNLASDFNQDTYPDGILAQTFTHGQPDDLGYWFAAGTSQATAEVSGAAAWLLADGAAPDEITTLLGASALPLSPHAEFDPATGAGQLSLDAARALFSDGTTAAPPTYFVNVLPWVEQANPNVSARLHVRIEVIDEAGHDVEGVEVGGCFYGSMYQCDLSGTTQRQGNEERASVTLTSGWIADIEGGIAGGFVVHGIAVGGVQAAARPKQFISISPAAAEVLYQLIDAPYIGESTLLFEIDPGDAALTALIDAEPAHGYLVKPVGAGLRSGAMTMVFTDAFAPEIAQPAPETITYFDWSWPSALDSGWGDVINWPAALIEAEVVKLGSGDRYVVMPLDPAMATSDIERFYPIINAPVEHFEGVNAQFGDSIASGPLANAFAASALGSGFVSSPLGSAFAASPLGSAFAASALGHAFAASPLGSGFAASPLGSAFAASALGHAFAASPLGRAFAASALGANYSADMGVGAVHLEDSSPPGP